MGLSTDGIIHLTKEKHSLEGILENGFRLKYCHEKISSNGSILSAAIPMISFCNIPLSEIKNHIDKYGEYGIGLTKDWASKNGLNPVLYMDEKSTVLKNFRDYFNNNMTRKKTAALTENEERLVDLVRYMKNFEGELKLKESTYDKYRFFDEHEWRYVPSKKELKNAEMLEWSENYDSKQKKETVNSKVKSIHLKFEPEDVKYILVKSDEDIGSVLHTIERLFDAHHTSAVIKKLHTRILTSDQIQSDF